MQRNVLLTVSMRYSVRREHDRFYAICHFMDVVGQGNSEDEAVAAMKEEVSVLFDFCSAEGTLEGLLAHRSSRYAPPLSLFRDIRVEHVRGLPPPDRPEWTSIEIDPAIIDRMMHGDLIAGES